MSTSPNLKITLLTVGQATPETTINNALLRLEQAGNRQLAVAMSGAGINTVLTADQFTTYGAFNCTGATGAATLTIPLTVDGNLTAINRMFFVVNGNAFNLVITSTGGADVTLAASQASLCYCNGTDITTILTAGTGLSSVSGDATPALGGDLNTNGHNITTTGDFAIVASSATGGSASIRFSSTGASPKIMVSGAVNIVGALTVSGTTSLGALNVSGALSVLGAAAFASVTVSGTLAVSGAVTLQSLTALQNVVTDGSKVLTTEAAIYDISPFFGGKPLTSGALMGYHLVGRNISLASGAVGWLSRAKTPATDGTKTIDIQKNGVSIGSIAFTTGAATGAFTFNATTTLSAGDRLEFYGPAVQDSAMADLAFFIKGTRVLP